MLAYKQYIFNFVLTFFYTEIWNAFNINKIILKNDFFIEIIPVIFMM